MMAHALDLSEAFVAADAGGWFIVVNEDHQSYDADGETCHGMSSHILGDPKGYRTYHEATAALYELRASKSQGAK